MRQIDQIVRDTLGNQAIEIIRLTSMVEALQEEINNLKKDSSKQAPEEA